MATDTQPTGAPLQPQPSIAQPQTPTPQSAMPQVPVPPPPPPPVQNIPTQPASPTEAALPTKRWYEKWQGWLVFYFLSGGNFIAMPLLWLLWRSTWSQRLKWGITIAVFIISWVLVISIIANAVGGAETSP